MRLIAKLFFLAVSLSILFALGFKYIEDTNGLSLAIVFGLLLVIIVSACLIASVLLLKRLFVVRELKKWTILNYMGDEVVEVKEEFKYEHMKVPSVTFVSGFKVRTPRVDQFGYCYSETNDLNQKKDKTKYYMVKSDNIGWSDKEIGKIESVPIRLF